jgi:hypothetical protein
MARPRTVKAGETEKKRAGDAPPEPGTYRARRAKGMLRAQERLSPEEMADGMRFTRGQLKVLDAIAAGLPVKGAREAMSALRLKADMTLQRPTASVAVDHRLVTYQIVSDPYADDPADALPPAALLAALPPAPADDDEVDAP